MMQRPHPRYLSGAEPLHCERWDEGGPQPHCLSSEIRNQMLRNGSAQATPSQWNTRSLKVLGVPWRLGLQPSQAQICRTWADGATGQVMRRIESLINKQIR
jgi:hypothetical protein